jgi:hypothetical protein
MNNTLIILVVAALAIYAIVRQFTEQQVTPRSLLLLPALSAYASYMDLQPAFARFSPALLIGGLVLGAALGILAGMFRGRHTQVRLDRASGNVFAKPDLICSVAWLVLLVVRIAVIALSYSPLGLNPVVGALTACCGSLFLLSVATQKYMVYVQSRNFQFTLPQEQVLTQRNRW